MSYVLIVQPNQDKKDGEEAVYDFDTEDPGIREGEEGVVYDFEDPGKMEGFEAAFNFNLK